eukprot:5003422-Pleurochrysis_carterae.AAC.1
MHVRRGQLGRQLGRHCLCSTHALLSRMRTRLRVRYCNTQMHATIDTPIEPAATTSATTTTAAAATADGLRRRSVDACAAAQRAQAAVERLNVVPRPRALEQQAQAQARTAPTRLRTRKRARTSAHTRNVHK